MPGKALVDTNLVIAIFSGEKSISQHLSTAEVCVSSTVLASCTSAHANPQTWPPTCPQSTNAAAVQVLNCDAATAQFYGQIKEQLWSKGRPIPENDIWIAATALQHGLSLATRDDHFKEIGRLRTERW